MRYRIQNTNYRRPLWGRPYAWGSDALFFPNARITIYAGHYGSGKTNLAVNHTLALRAEGRAVTVLDLDIVNPYFRTADSAALFEREGIGLISSRFANTNVDVPALPPAMYAAFDDTSSNVVVDVGGDDRGALALGRFSDRLAGGEAELVLVINRYRPLAAKIEGALDLMREMEKACHARFTGIAANHNLGGETTAETVLAGEEYTLALSRESGLPVLFRAALRPLIPALEGKLDRLEPIDLYGRTVF